MNKRIIALTLFAVCGWASIGNVVACTVLPPIASEVCIKLCDNVTSPVGRAICKLGQDNHNA
ncbi:hypothetical protein [Pantoea sp. B65]|uniref:hypothetical protein n=1 Tax=Pantoea sp. B65 TaxID=2813359 RepID=UPI0039B4A3A6